MQLLEVHIEAADPEASLAFYQSLLDCEKIIWRESRLAVFMVLRDGTAFGIWKKGSRGIHNGQAGAHVHFAFRIDPDEYDEYRDRLASLGVTILDYDWEDGHRSLYFFDPDGHQGEFMTKGWLEGE